MQKHPTRDIRGRPTVEMQMWSLRTIMKLQPGLLSGICIILDMWYGDHPGTGITIQDTGVPGGLITGTIITGTILTGITIITLTIVTGTVTGAETIVPTIEAECTCTVLMCM